MERHKISVAVDGPAGAGKSSISKIVANKLGYLYIDTGAMYRAITWGLLEEDVCVDNEADVLEVLPKLDLGLEPTPNGLKVSMNGRDITEEIRKQRVTRHVSTVAAYKAVRARLVEIQRELSKDGGIILDGRDIGSVVLPHAELKLFLTASVETRGRRRWLEIKDTEDISLEEVCRTVADRDEMDKTRKESPLICVDDAVVINSDNLTFDETVDVMTKLILEKEEAQHG